VLAATAADERDERQRATAVVELFSQGAQRLFSFR
jgi:hypothetical protein